jgi:2-C-methyl-D-erythritol 2,4-cyclodiphosphate synthase
MRETRTGLGFDVHRFDPERALFLGGVHFEGEPGLAGHSDGDAVCHALADALLGAVAAGDLGQHFPESDPSNAGIGGLDLLARTVAIASEHGFAPASCDVTVIGERPAVAPRRDEVRARLAATLGVPVASVSVKATRPEGLGLAGDGVGCLALATVVPVVPVTG